MRLVLRLGFIGCLGLSACPGGGSSPADVPCVPNLTPDCKANYATPNFDTVFGKILQPNCATGTGTCHTSDFDAGGLVFQDPDVGYRLLLGADGGTAFVIPDDAGCSTLMKRLESMDPNYHMPKGSTFLPDGDLCTIVQWIAQGAQR